MCAERIHRLMMATLFALSIMFFTLFNDELLIMGIYLQSTLIILMLIWGLFNICPTLWLLRKFFRNCKNFTCIYEE